MKIGFTASSFDLLHGGHISMLEESKNNCDYLIVGLNIKPIKNNKPPVQSVFERYLQLRAVKYIDEIIPYDGEDELMEIFNTLKIDIRFIGSDYKDRDFTGKNINIDNNTEIFYNRRDHKFSSSSLKEKVINNNKKAKYENKKKK